MKSDSAIRALVVVTTRYQKNGITGVVKNYAANIDPADVRFDYLLVNEPTPEERADIEARGGRIFVLKRNRNPFSYEKKLEALLKAERYDLVHAHGNSATLLLEMRAAKRAGIPVRIAHSHNTATSFPLLHRMLNRAFQRDTTHCLACGDAAGKWLFRDRPFTVLPNAIDTERFTFKKEDRDRARRGFKLEKNRVYVHVGSFIPAKNHAYLIDAFTNIRIKDPSARLLLAGGGKRMEEIKKRAYFNRVQRAVIFLGDQADVKSVYAAADAFLLPSKHEGLPLTLLEAQSMGLPCLVSEAVTKEADVTGLVKHAVLSDGMDRFAAAAMGLEKRSVDERAKAHLLVEQAGYGIKARAAELVRFYRACMRDSGQ